MGRIAIVPFSTLSGLKSWDIWRVERAEQEASRARVRLAEETKRLAVKVAEAERELREAWAERQRLGITAREI